MEGSVLFWVTYGVLWLLTAFLAFVVMMLLREHIDVLQASREGRSLLHGPPEQGKAPLLPKGSELERGEAFIARDGQPKPRLVIFMGVHCAACWEHRALVSAFAEDHAQRVEVAIACVGDADEVREFVAEIWTGVRVYADPDGRIAGSWRVFVTPFAVALDIEERVAGKLATPNLDNLTMLLARIESAEPAQEDAVAVEGRRQTYAS
jgi:hypothetical protein